MRFCEMREKEVVNICTGKQLGCVVDLELDTCSGKIESIIVPGNWENFADFSERTVNM